MIKFGRSAIFVLATVLIVSAITHPQSAGAPRIYDIEFVNGVYVDKGSVFLPSPCPPNGPQGVCGNGNSRGYSLKGKPGDQITIDVVSDKKTAIFSIFYPDYTLIRGASAVTKWTGKLTVDGSFRLNVYTNKMSTPYTLRITRVRNGKRI